MKIPLIFEVKSDNNLYDAQGNRWGNQDEARDYLKKALQRAYMGLSMPRVNTCQIESNRTYRVDVYTDAVSNPVLTDVRQNWQYVPNKEPNHSGTYTLTAEEHGYQGVMRSYRGIPGSHCDTKQAREYSLLQIGEAVKGVIRAGESYYNLKPGSLNAVVTTHDARTLDCGMKFMEYLHNEEHDPLANYPWPNRDMKRRQFTYMGIPIERGPNPWGHIAFP